MSISDYMKRAAPLLALGVMLLTAGAAQAQITNAFTFKNLVYRQSGAGGANVAYDFAFYNAGIISANPGDFSAATVTLPDSTVQSLTMTDARTFGLDATFATVAGMDMAYPFGTYTFNASGATPQSAALTYDRDAYAMNVGRLDGLSYDALQGLNTRGGLFTVNFNAQQAAAMTNAFTFFTIYGSDQNCQFVATTATSCAINPRHLMPGTTYTYELDFSNRIEDTSEGFLKGVNFDVRTEGSFTTAAAAVPEPASWAMMILGLGAVGAAGRRRRARALA